MVEGNSSVLLAKRLFAGPKCALVENAAVLVRDGHIRDIGHRDAVTVPPGASVIDLGDRSLLPGLIDAHVHFYGVPSTRLYTAPFEEDAYRALRAAGEARRMLEAGFTAARCCGSSIGPALRRAIDDGHIPGPRLIAAGEFVCTTNGTFDPNSHFSVPLDWAKAQSMLADGADGVRELVRRRLRGGSTVIKIGLSKGAEHDRTMFPVWGADPFDQVLAMTPEEIAAVTHEAHVNKLRVSAHCVGDAAVRAALEFGVDTIEHGFGISDETRRRLVDQNALVVTTLSVMHLLSDNADSWGMSADQQKIIRGHIDAQRRDFEKGLSAGVRYALGTDLVGSPTHPNDMASLEFALAVECGMAPSQALIAGTTTGAAALGMEDSIGSIDVGKLADMIAVAGDPLRDIECLQHVDFVMQGGEVIIDRRPKEETDCAEETS
jgi:imidazolonepropionase-like amidohydrolase